MANKNTNGTRGKTIKVTCTGAATAKLEDLYPLQGDLKHLSDTKYRKLRRSLLTHGFSFPFFVWKDHGKLWVLDGHQRDRALVRLKGLGYKIPPLPIVFIEAKDQKQAMEKILLLASRYGDMTEDSLQRFLEETGLDLEELTETTEIPDIEIDRLLNDMANGHKVESSGPKFHFQVIVDCNTAEEQLQLLAKLEGDKYKVRTRERRLK